MLLVSCGRFGSSIGRNVTFCANAFQIKSYRMPRFSVSLLLAFQSSCAHAAYFGILTSVRKFDASETPTEYRVAIAPNAGLASCHVSALNGSGSRAVIFAGTGPPLTVAVPPHWLQLRVLSSRCRHSPPALR